MAGCNFVGEASETVSRRTRVFTCGAGEFPDRTREFSEMVKDILYKGYTTEPSDYECPDGTLATSLNLIHEDEQLKPVFQPGFKFGLNTGEELLWIHKMKEHTHYIIMLTTTSGDVTTRQLYWVCEENGEHDVQTLTRHAITGSSVEGDVTLGSIGNTLIVNDDNGISYFLWTTVEETVGGVTTRVLKYVALGQKPPMLEITFGLHSDFAVVPDKKNTDDDYQSEYKGAIIDMGNIKEPVVPHLGNNDEYLTAWAKPKPVAENWTGTHADVINKFAAESATYSVEDMTSTDNDDVLASLSKFKNMLTQGVFAKMNVFTGEKGTKENKFVLPFFVRYAYRLYDGSYIMHSYPVLMIPNSRGPVFAIDGTRGICLNDNSDEFVEVKVRGRVYGFLSELVYSITQSQVLSDLQKWKDLIMSVDIGVSAPIYPFDQGGQVYGWTNMDDAHAWDEYYTVSKVLKLAEHTVASPSWGVHAFLNEFKTFENAQRQSSWGDYFNRYDGNVTYNYPSYIATVPLRSISDINNDLTGATNFYIIKQFKLDDLATGTEQSLDLEEGTLGGLLGRKTISDDYRTHDTLKSSLIYNYNGRINYANVERTPHAPLNPAVQFAQEGTIGSGNTCEVAVTIKNDLEEITVKSASGYYGGEFPRWIFYPDAKAEYAYVRKAGTTYRVKLTPHDFLNGAYWLPDILKQSVLSQAESGATMPTVAGGSFKEQNKLYTSNVNNPFLFEPTNINTVGTGEIIGIRSAARALSQGQFGQFPLYAFTTEGVWALELSASGTFSARQPITRDVCINAAGITQIDSAVLFVTDRGIMLIGGSQVECITGSIFAEHPFDVTTLPWMDALHAMLGTGHGADACVPVKPLLGFLRGCRMVYDYVHQHIIVFNPATTTTDGVTTQDYTYAYVYSLKSQSWGMIYSDLKSALNSYPDALAVTHGGNVVTFSSTDETTRKGLYVTRPLKLDAADVLKTVSEIVQRGNFQRGDVVTVLYGSRDLVHWHLVWSSTDHYLRGFSGTPWKYFRIAGVATLAGGKSVLGASVRFEQRFINKLR